MKRLATLVACLLLAGCSAAPASTPAVTTTSPAATTPTSTPLAGSGALADAQNKRGAFLRRVVFVA